MAKVHDDDDFLVVHLSPVGGEEGVLDVGISILEGIGASVVPHSMLVEELNVE